MDPFRRSISLVFLGSVAFAQVRPWKAAPASSTERAAERAAHPERVHHDVREDGTQLARGATYKAQFDARGATYVPFLGSRAPRSFPVAFRLESASIGGAALAFDPRAVPQRRGETIEFDRGSLVEIYELAPRSIEQKIVLHDRPGGGRLVLR